MANRHTKLFFLSTSLHPFRFPSHDYPAVASKKETERMRGLDANFSFVPYFAPELFETKNFAPLCKVNFYTVRWLLHLSLRTPSKLRE